MDCPSPSTINDHTCWAAAHGDHYVTGSFQGLGKPGVLCKCYIIIAMDCSSPNRILMFQPTNFMSKPEWWFIRHIDHTWRRTGLVPGAGSDSGLMIILGNGQWTADGYVIMIVYLHKTPFYPSPWNKACYVTITVYLHKTPIYPSPWNKACYITISLFT